MRWMTFGVLVTCSLVAGCGDDSDGSSSGAGGESSSGTESTAGTAASSPTASSSDESASSVGSGPGTTGTGGGDDLGAIVCERLCGCVGCTPDELDECGDEIGAQKSEAESRGCGAEAEAYLSCYDEAFECVDEKDVTDGCDGEAEALNVCLQS